LSFLPKQGSVGKRSGDGVILNDSSRTSDNPPVWRR
jgi:hypothetical protein